MKIRLSILFIFLLLVTPLVAQERATLAAQVREAQSRRDSISTIVTQLRHQYASDEASRAEVGKKIVSKEAELMSATIDYNRAAAALAAYDSTHATEANPVVPQEANGSATVRKPSSGRVRANLVQNDFFRTELSADDYSLLLSAQQKEKSVVAAIAEYTSNYNTRLSLQREYATTESEHVADSLMNCFARKSADAVTIEQRVAQSWSEVLDNKTYAYNLLMEKSGRSELLASSELMSAETSRTVEAEAGQYASDVLAGYGAWKRWLLDYETNIASSLGLRSAKDSLQRVAAVLKNTELKLPKIEIEQRYFLEYEPIKVMRTTYYTPKNPIPQTKVYEHGTMYRIRIGLFSKRPNVSALHGVTPLSYSTNNHGNLYAYYVGGFRSLAEAEEGVEHLKRLGFRAPVVSVWHDGKYYSDAKSWEAKYGRQMFSIEISGVATLPDTVREHIRLRNEGCAFSKVGDKFVAGRFESKELADIVAEEIRRMDAQIQTSVVETKK